jgi:hypothetical protein
VSILSKIPLVVLDRAVSTLGLPTGTFTLNPDTGIREPVIVNKTVELYFKESGTKGQLKVYLFSPTELTTTQLQSLIDEPFKYQFKGTSNGTFNEKGVFNLSGIFNQPIYTGERGWLLLERIITQPSPVALKLLGYCFSGRKGNDRDVLRMGR